MDSTEVSESFAGAADRLNRALEDAEELIVERFPGVGARTEVRDGKWIGVSKFDGRWRLVAFDVKHGENAMPLLNMPLEFRSLAAGLLNELWQACSIRNAEIRAGTEQAAETAEDFVRSKRNS